MTKPIVSHPKISPTNRQNIIYLIANKSFTRFKIHKTFIEKRHTQQSELLK